jgi:type VI secretion system secreted protein VgrG
MANDNQDNSTSSNDEAASSVPSGGAGSTPAWSDPDIVMSAPAGITMLTPQSASFNAGSTTSVAAGQDINLLAQANLSYSIKGGISLFTYGKASNPKKPNQEVGIKLHAASGKVSSRSQSDKTQVTADKGIEVNSTHDAVHIQAKEHVLLTAGGAYIKLSGGNIEVHAPGMVDFKASMKSWTGPKSDSVVPPNFPAVPLQPNQLVIERLYHDQEALAGTPFEAEFADGSVRKGVLDGAGRAAIDDAPPGAANVRFGAMPGAYERKDKTPMPDHKPQPSQSDIDALIDKYSAITTTQGADK